jgi:Tol biopolymer transport system component
MSSRLLLSATAAVALAFAAVGTALSTTHGTNGLIAYSQGHDDRYNLFTIRPDGTGAKQITSGAGWVNADWSSDGRSMVVERDGPDHASILRIDANGKVLRTLASKGFQGQPSFSPGGAWVAYERDLGQGNNGVWLMRANGTGLRRLTRSPFACCDTDPNFSPDGKLISFVRVRREGREQALFVVRPTGTGLRQLTPYSWEVAIKHDWSPDGKLILLTTNADFVQPGASANMVTIRPDGSGKTQLTTFSGGTKNAFAGSFSPDGKQVVFRLEEGTSYSLATMDLASRAITKLTTGPEKPRFIDWGTHQ